MYLWLWYLLYIIHNKYSGTSILPSGNLAITIYFITVQTILTWVTIQTFYIVYALCIKSLNWILINTLYVYNGTLRSMNSQKRLHQTHFYSACLWIVLLYATLFTPYNISWKTEITWILLDPKETDKNSKPKVCRWHYMHV